MGIAAHPAAGDSPGGRARRGPRERSPAPGATAGAAGQDAGDLSSWTVPGVTDEVSDPDRAGGRRKRRERRGPEEQAERAERARRDRQAELEADPEAVARQICLRLLTAAPRTRAQLAGELRKRGVPEQAAETVLERFADVQLIDDAMFARAWVDSRHHGRGLARRALAAELRQRGIAAEEIRTAVDRVDPEQEHATACALVGRRLASTRGLPRETRFRRLMGMLARKGYSEGLAYRVVREALDSEDSDAVRYLGRLAGRDATPAGLLDADRFDEPAPEPEDDPGPGLAGDRDSW
jgi:regulatory protein